MKKLLVLLLVIIAVLSQKDEIKEEARAIFDIDKANITDIILRRCPLVCPLGNTCIAGRCIPIFFGCAWRRCPFGYFCILGRCIRLPIFWSLPCIGGGCDLQPEFPFLREELAEKFPDVKELKTDL